MPFSDEDQVPLGYRSTIQDTFSLRIDHFDGLFENQNIYIEDRLLNVIHNLKLSPYVFTSAAGTFNNRFILRYTDVLLGTHHSNADSGVIAFIDNEKINIQSSEIINAIEIFDITGKLIAKYVPQAPLQYFEHDFIYAEGIYMAKIKTVSGAINTQKLIHKK